MGRDKALLPYRAHTLAGFVAREVARAAGSAVLVGSPQAYESIGFSIISDRYPGEGPLGGIVTALADTEAQWNLVTACDMPAVSADFFKLLLETAEAADCGALIPINPVSGRSEPLCAVYARHARTALEAAFARGVRKVMAALEDSTGELRVVRFTTAEVASFRNVNTPEEWAAVDL